MKKWLVVICLLLLIMIPADAKAVQLIVDGENITDIAKPVIIDNRTLVPIKFIGDELDAEVTWEGEIESVLIKKDQQVIRLWIGSRLVDLNNGESYLVTDVAPIIINDRTYVPLKLISDIFSVGVKWDEETWSVFVNSDEPAVVEDYHGITFESLTSQAVIDQNRMIKIQGNFDEATEAQIIILDPVTAKGFVRARSIENLETLNYIPKPADQGGKVLVYALLNASRELISAQAIPVQIELNPIVTLEGVHSEQTYSKLKMSQSMNFLPRYISYQLTNIETNEVINITQRDHHESYTFYPSIKQNGIYDIQVIAYDSQQNAYYSQKERVNLHVDEYLRMGGVSEGQIISKPVSLIASRNFDVYSTSYFMVDVQSGEETLIQTQDWGSYKWFPDERYSGEKQLYVQVEDVKGNIRNSNRVNVTIDGSPKLIMYGVGPKQVLTDAVTLSVKSNVDMTNLRYYIVAESNKDTFSEVLEVSDTFTFTPVYNDSYVAYSEGQYNGKIYRSTEVNFKVNLQTTYGPKAIIEKSSFQSYISDFAVESFEKTGMSASLQTAQAILETGWGQRLPVDKYTGKFSYNLFGIKGSATNGSVVSNTWEVYNGVTYRVDANFRAYNNVEESWADHKRILLELSRYAPYRAVMHDSTEGAFAVRRCGYATDPKYPMKLINIIDKYNLEILDKLTI